MKIKYEPIGNTVLVEAVAIKTSIQLPDSIQSDKYTVVALGNGDKVPKELSVGDVVILSPGFGMVPVKNTNYVITNADNILARINAE